MSIRGVHTWEGETTARWPWIIMIISLVAAVIFGIFGRPIVSLIILAASIPAMAFTKIGVSTGPHGIRIAYGPFGWPTQTIGIDRIEAAEVMDVNPLKWGGWGYRGSLKVFKRAAVTLRGGPGIFLHLKKGKQFVVTVDEPALGVNVLNQSILMAPPPMDGSGSDD